MCDSNGSAVPPDTPLDESIVSEDYRWIRPQDQNTDPSRQEKNENVKQHRRAAAASFKQALLRMIVPSHARNNTNTKGDAK